MVSDGVKHDTYLEFNKILANLRKPFGFWKISENEIPKIVSTLNTIKMPTHLTLFVIAGGEFMIIFLILALMLVLLYPIYKLYKHLKTSHANNWAWAGFIVLVIKSCSSSSSSTSTFNNQRPKIERTYKNIWSGKAGGNEKGFSVFISFDSTSIKYVEYSSLGIRFMYRLENNPIFIENIGDDNPATPEIDFTVSENQYKIYPFPFGGLTSSETIKIEGKCNSENGECNLKINGEVFDVKCRKNESIGYHINKE